MHAVPAVTCATSALHIIIICTSSLHTHETVFLPQTPPRAELYYCRKRACTIGSQPAPANASFFFLD